MFEKIIKLSIVSILLLISSCTITKRRYTGGYYLGWQSKAPAARSLPQVRICKPISNMIVLSSNFMCNVYKKDGELKTFHVINFKPKEIVYSTKKSDKVEAAISIQNDTVNQNDKKNQHTISKSAPPLFGSLSILSGFLSLIFIFPFYGFSLSVPIVGIILSVLLACLSIHKAHRILRQLKGINSKKGGKGAAIWGIGLSAIGVLIDLFTLILIFSIS